MASLTCCKLLQHLPAWPVLQIEILSSNLHYLIQRLMSRDFACQRSFLKCLFLLCHCCCSQKDTHGLNSNSRQTQFVSHPEDRLPAPASERHHAGFASVQTGGPNLKHCLSTVVVAVATAAGACTLRNVLCSFLWFQKAGDL